MSPTSYQAAPPRVFILRDLVLLRNCGHVAALTSRQASIVGDFSPASALAYNGIDEEYEISRASGPMVPLSSGRDLCLGQSSMGSRALRSCRYSGFCIL